MVTSCGGCTQSGPRRGLLQRKGDFVPPTSGKVKKKDSTTEGKKEGVTFEPENIGKEGGVTRVGGETISPPSQRVLVRNREEKGKKPEEGGEDVKATSI